MEVQGSVALGYESVREAFISSFQDKPEMGASLAIRVGGDEVVKLWGGYSDYSTGELWSEETISVIFSCSKGLMSILSAQLVQDGLISYDDLVSKYWPEFTQAGKGEVTFGDLLAHRAGLSASREDISSRQVIDWNYVTNMLAAQEPLWEPGTGHAYHALTHGWLVGEVLSRATGLSVSELFTKYLTKPLASETWMGLPSELEARVARMHAGPTMLKLIQETNAARDPLVPDWIHRSMTLGAAFPPDLISYDGGFNSSEIRAAVIPGAGGISSASSLAALWSATVIETEGVRFLSPETVALATTIKSEGMPVFPVPGPWSKYGMGFQLGSEANNYLGSKSFGHGGAGGQVTFADPVDKVGFAFLTNQMEAIDDFRGSNIVDALRDVLRR